MSRKPISQSSSGALRKFMPRTPVIRVAIRRIAPQAAIFCCDLFNRFDTTASSASRRPVITSRWLSTKSDTRSTWSARSWKCTIASSLMQGSSLRSDLCRDVAERDRGPPEPHQGLARGRRAASTAPHRRSCRGRHWRALRPRHRRGGRRPSRSRRSTGRRPRRAAPTAGDRPRHGGAGRAASSNRRFNRLTGKAPGISVLGVLADRDQPTGRRRRCRSRASRRPSGCRTQSYTATWKCSV